MPKYKKKLIVIGLLFLILALIYGNAQYKKKVKLRYHEGPLKE